MVDSEVPFSSVLDLVSTCLSCPYVTNQRAAMNAEVFEAIMCLKYNRALWDKQVIAMARAEVRDRDRYKGGNNN